MKRIKTASNIDVEYFSKLFFEVIDSIRYSRDYYNPSYKHLERSIKVKTTEDIKKIAEIAAVHFCSEIAKDRAKYLNSRQRIDQLKRTSLELAISIVESA